MKKLLKLLKKSIIVALLCLTITNTAAASWCTDPNVVSTCSDEETNPNENTNPFKGTDYS